MVFEVEGRHSSVRDLFSGLVVPTVMTGRCRYSFGAPDQAQHLAEGSQGFPSPVDADGTE